MAASLDDILTAQKNGVQAINSVNNTNQSLQGSVNSGEISTTKYFKTQYGWVARISVIVAGSTTGMIYDANSVAGAVTGNRLYVIQNTVGIQSVMLPVNNGIVVTPGTGMILTISYN